MAQRVGRELAARGLVVVSGMARGIDAIGHQGAMDANGRAIGVRGTGIDVCYPKENKKLYEKVLVRGAIISEFLCALIPRRRISLCVTGSAAAALDGSENKLYELLSADQPVHIDDIVERSGLNSSEVLATLFNLEMKGIIRQLPGKQFSKVLL
jgi:predicted Rossmann fold nucleotide-binding protein DprA/Smf involved in DNA uptake